MTIYTKNLTEELETIHRAVAELCGWGSIKRIDTADGFTVFRGKPKDCTYMMFVPDYIISIDAIWKAFEGLGWHGFQLIEQVSRDINKYEASYSSNGINFIVTRANTPALALCKLLLVATKNDGQRSHTSTVNQLISV